MEFIKAKNLSGDPGVYMVSGNEVRYVGKCNFGWWWWVVFVKNEDLNKEYICHLVDEVEYATEGYSECGFSSFTEAMTAALVGFEEKKKYRIEFTQTLYVEANDKDEARERAEEMLGDWNCYIEEME